MLKTVILAENALEPSTWEEYQATDLVLFLMDKFPKWPDTARIYHKWVAQECDVTPVDEATTEALNRLDGTFYVVVYPAGTPLIIAAVALAAVIAAVIFLKPSIPVIDRANPTSTNNALSDRQNKERVNGRIPDILGTVRATPDLLMVPYKLFVNDVETEYSYMCLGRGRYNILDVKEDTTVLEEIDGSGCEIYGPNWSPNGGVPLRTYGESVSIGHPLGLEPIRNFKRYSAVDGLDLPPKDLDNVEFDKLQFLIQPPSWKKYIVSYNHGPKFDMVDVGDTFWLHDAGTYSQGAFPWLFDATGMYTVVDKPDDWTLEVSPAGEALLTTWLTFAGQGGTSSINPGKFNFVKADNNTDWVNVDDPQTTLIIANVVAPNGIYQLDDAGRQKGLNVIYWVEYQPITVDGVPFGSVSIASGSITGSNIYRDLIGVSIYMPVAAGRYRVRVNHSTPRHYPKASDGTIVNGSVEETSKWRDLYSTSSANISPSTHFGDVTTIFTKTKATRSALALKERKLNMLVTRMIDTINNDGSITPFTSTNRACDILRWICIDPYIGNRTSAELDTAGFLYAHSSVVNAFGDTSVGEFNYSLDNDNMSFEETAATVASTFFCTAFRRGNLIQISPELATPDSVLLFNHRNKIPGSEKRTFKFPELNEYDGIELEYVNPIDETVATYYVPLDRSALNPNKIQSVGIRSRLQAHFHAWRLWNKLKYQHITVEFQATQESDLLVLQDRILVADNTRPDTMDGYVLDQNGLQLQLSQPVNLNLGGFAYTIFLQHTDGTVEAIPVVNWDGLTEAGTYITLGRPPKLALVMDDTQYAQTTYVIVRDSSPRERAFLVTEKEPQDNFTSIVRAINYDDRYYQNDNDLKTGIVWYDGTVL